MKIRGQNYECNVNILKFVLRKSKEFVYKFVQYEGGGCRGIFNIELTKLNLPAFYSYFYKKIITETLLELHSFICSLIITESK